MSDKKQTPKKQQSKKKNDQVKTEEQKVVLMMPEIKVDTESSIAYQVGDKTISVPKESEQDSIAPYISNLKGNVYVITGLPEEFIATLFAWVSRSPKSFREHLKIAAKEFQLPSVSMDPFDGLNKKAKDFHEKWTVGYGHSSVAEHAVSHVGIEKVSRLASAELELSNTFYSITEYSQRYQKPVRGEWYLPFKKVTRDYNENGFKERYDQFMDLAFDTFEALIEGVFRHLCEKEGILPETDKTEESEVILKRKALQKLAFEDARYVLPLSMYTQLGMTANGRAWRDGIAKMGTSIYSEVKQLSNDLRTEITKVLPVLLKYATPSSYQKQSNDYLRITFDGLSRIEPEHKVLLQPVQPEAIILDKVVAHWMVEFEGCSYSDAINHAKFMSSEAKNNIIAGVLKDMEHFDVAPDAFKHVQYSAELIVSEANWHQLLRHNRATDFSYGRPSIYHGMTIPPRIKEAGLEWMIEQVKLRAEDLYEDILHSDTPELADYVVLNAHNRQVTATFSLWEAYHLINLRTSEEAQWDIRETFEELHEQLKLVHPTLINKAQRR